MTVTYKASTPCQTRVTLSQTVRIQFYLAPRGFRPTNSNHRGWSGIFMVQDTITKFIDLSLHDFCQIPRGLGRLKQPFVPTKPQMPNAKEKVMSLRVAFPFCKHLTTSIYLNPVHYLQFKCVMHSIRQIGLYPKNLSCCAFPLDVTDSFWLVMALVTTKWHLNASLSEDNLNRYAIVIAFP